MDPVVLSPFEELIQKVGVFVTEAIDWVSDWAGAITSSNLLVLSCIAVPLAEFGIVALARLMRRKA